MEDDDVIIQQHGIIFRAQTNEKSCVPFYDISCYPSAQDALDS